MEMCFPSQQQNSNGVIKQRAEANYMVINRGYHTESIGAKGQKLLN
jgi:hypothetical protein